MGVGKVNIIDVYRLCFINRLRLVILVKLDYDVNH